MSMIEEAFEKVEQERKDIKSFMPDKPVQEERKLGNVVDQITHFYEKRPNTLQTEHTNPELYNNYPKDGNITIRLIKDKGSQAFKLNVNEAYRFANVILDLCELHRSVTKKLWDSREV